MMIAAYPRTDAFEQVHCTHRPPALLFAILYVAIETVLTSMNEMPVSSSIEILLVDDNELHRDLISRMLHHVGYTADVVKNGVEALEAVEKKQYSLILMDLAMPKLDGFQATRTIRSQNPTLDPYIIAVTALNLEYPKETCRAVGIDDVLQKPILLEEFRAAIDRYHDAQGEGVA